MQLVYFIGFLNIFPFVFHPFRHRLIFAAYFIFMLKDNFSGKFTGSQ